MGNRPINRRPFRRAPWRKKSRRPHRWISLNCGATLSDEGFILAPWDVSPVTTSGQPPNVVLASGQADVEPWADNQEVTIDRIVGDITIRGIVSQNFASPVDVPSAPSVSIRLGMLVQEEGDSTSSPFINMWSDEHLEDFEWMYLQERCASDWNYSPVEDTDVNNRAGLGWNDVVHIDLHVRRKLGQTDNLLLYAQYGVGVLPGATADVSITGSHLLRSIFMSK